MRTHYLFRKVLLPLAATLLLAGSAPVSAQQTILQYLNQNIVSFTVGDNSVVNLMTGDTNMVSVVSNKNLDNVIKVTDGNLEVRQGNYIVNLTLKEPQTLAIEATGNATVNVADMKCPRLSVKARANALVNMTTLESQHVQLSTLGNARINADFLNLTDNRNNNSTQLRAIAGQNTSIYIDSIIVGMVYLRGTENASITLHAGIVHNKLETTYNLDEQVQINTTGVWSNNRIDSDMPEVDALQEMSASIESVASGWRFHSHMLWGFHNWGEVDNGLASAGGANTVRTTFNTFQWNFQWKLVKRAHCDLSAGIGFEWDRYKFSNNYVRLSTDGTQGYFETWDAATLAANDLPAADLDAWKSRLITRYVTMPITYSIYFANKKMKATLGVVPGMRLDGKKTGMRYFYDDGDVDYKDRMSASEYINPFKCDVLAMLKFGCIGLYVQVPTMPINRNMNVDLYPIKFGIVI